MNTIYYVGIILVITIVILWILIKNIERNNNLSSVLKGLTDHFSNEKLLEFRIKSATAKKKIRIFEVKTIRQKYYNVYMDGNKFKKLEDIEKFSGSESDYFLIGKINLVTLNEYQLFISKEAADSL